jgi:2-hydroxy-6-oxonona-2,4-dienedioate hydrolase
MSAAVPALPSIHHREWQSADGTIHYVEAGTGDPVLLIHGGHGAWVHWIANIEALAQHRRVVALDLPGFGHSYAPQRRLEVEEYAAVVSGFIDALGLRNTALAGFSFGTLVAATLAGMRPDAISSLTLINPPGIGERSAEALAIPERLAALAREQGVQAGVAGTLRELMLFNKAHITSELIDLIVDCVRRTHYETRSLSRRAQTVSLLERLSQRVMVLIGADDPYHRHELEGRRERINRALGTDSVTIVAEAAHWLQYDQRDFFNRALLEFISGKMN